MTEIDYPPSRTVALGDALASVEARLEDGDGDGDLANQRDALAWGVEEFGAAAEVTVAAFTAATRARVLDELRDGVVGEPGPREMSLWLVAAGVDAAPWLDGGEDIAARAAVTGELPPALVDWLESILDDVNDLSQGN